jgi:hypothetical protein
MAKSFFIQQKSEKVFGTLALGNSRFAKFEFWCFRWCNEISTYKIHAMMQCSIDKLMLRGQK